MTFWMKTVNTEKVLESYISEILETLEKTSMIGANSKLSFFNNEYWIDHLWKVSRDFTRYFKISEI